MIVAAGIKPRLLVSQEIALSITPWPRSWAQKHFCWAEFGATGKLADF